MILFSYLINNSVFSGGKDSTYNMIQCVQNGHEIIALANLHPKKDIGKNDLHNMTITFVLFG